MEKVPGPRPVVGSPLHLVVLRDTTVDVISSVMRFDRGRGMVVEADKKPAVPFKKDDRVVLAYAVGDTVYAMRGTVSEVLAPTRVYVQANSMAVEMEKREYIRAILAIPSALVVQAKAPAASLALTQTSVELSASGFRWFGHVNGAVGATAWLCLELPNRNDGRTDIQSTIVRAEPCGDSFEVAGHFVGIDPAVQECIVDLVFRHRLEELGIHAGRSWDEDA